MEVRGPDLSEVAAKDNIWCYNCGNVGHIARVYQEEREQKADQLTLLWVLVGQYLVVKTVYANDVKELLQKLVSCL